MEIKHRIELLKLLPPNPVVAEIGVAQGLFSRDMLENGASKLYCVDNWNHIPNITGDGNFPKSFHDENYEHAKELLAPYGERVVMLKGFSINMAKEIDNNSLDLAYIDCDHTYNGVMNDLHSYFPKVKHGGIIAMHDYFSPAYGVKQAVEDFCRGRFDIIIIPEDHIDDAGAYFYKK